MTAKRDDIIRFTVSLPSRLLKELDKHVGKNKYPSRSEYVRDLIREKIVESKWSGSADDVVGVLTISYDHHQRGLTQKILDIQHGAAVDVLCTTHVHLDHHNCLEAIIIKGGPADIDRISIQLGGLRGVKYARLTRASAVAS
ncbi:MAG: nickel-responsive transcriptional regulator NikR [bacterium]